jgi:hypothetical protein
MATQNIIQYLETSQYNALPAGGTIAVGVEASNRRQIETFISGAAIAANDLVALDFSKTSDGEIAITIVKADSASANSIAVVGFALNAATGAGENVDVTIAGLHQSANVAGAVAKGDRLSISAVAGQADTYVNSDTVPIIAYACEDDTANVASVFVIKQF